MAEASPDQGRVAGVVRRAFDGFSTRAALAGGAVSALVLALDQASKAWILYGLNLPSRGHVELSPIMDFSMVWNRGVSFGLLSAESDLGRWLLTAFMLIVAALLFVWMGRSRRPLLRLSLALVVGGAVGNAIDRILYGAVVDFLDFRDIFFPWVFNVADSAICVGGALILLDSLIGKEQPR